MPLQSMSLNDFLSCQSCRNKFDNMVRAPLTLCCGHSLCRTCLQQLPQLKCPFDQYVVSQPLSELLENFAILQLIGGPRSEQFCRMPKTLKEEETPHYTTCKTYIENLVLYLKPASNTANLRAPNLSRSMQKKLGLLVTCQLGDAEGRARLMKTLHTIGERITSEMIMLHQNSHQLSTCLWAAIRSHGCQFLGPAIQEDVLKLIVLALKDNAKLSRKVLVQYVVQQLEKQYPQASKTAIGHVVQLLYRASCFKVTKREQDSSLMEVKEEFVEYEALRREHDTQIVQIAIEAGLHISPEQWSSLLYGDSAHKSHMQSIIDRLQTPQSFSQNVSNLILLLQRTSDPCEVLKLCNEMTVLANISLSNDVAPSWETLEQCLAATSLLIQKLVDCIRCRELQKNDRKQNQLNRYKTSMCRDLQQKGYCPRDGQCSFAHSREEMQRYRLNSKKNYGKLLPGHRYTADENSYMVENIDSTNTDYISASDSFGTDITDYQTDPCFVSSHSCSFFPDRVRNFSSEFHSTVNDLQISKSHQLSQSGIYSSTYSTLALSGDYTLSPLSLSNSDCMSSSLSSMIANVSMASHAQLAGKVTDFQSQDLERLHKKRDRLISELKDKYKELNLGVSDVRRGHTLSWSNHRLPVSSRYTAGQNLSAAIFKGSSSDDIATLSCNSESADSEYGTLPQVAWSTAEDDPVYIDKDLPANMSSVDNWSASSNKTSTLSSLNDDGDEFIPFEPAAISRYGPISRSTKPKASVIDAVTAKMSNTTSVTAMPCQKRPLAASVEAPSRYSLEPTANKNDSNSSLSFNFRFELPVMKENTMSYQLHGPDVGPQQGQAICSSVNIQKEIEQLQQRIRQLRMIECDRIKIELLSIESNIKELYRGITNGHSDDDNTTGIDHIIQQPTND